ncbi:prefoldin subunit alpha [Candidatus Woesearchaeota archaeon]|nr:prefoldin subunit alpha [Candidatus Woesearchaeota archaeon]
MKDEDKQRKYVELHVLKQQLDQLQQQIVNLRQQVFELGSLSESLDSIKDVAEGTEIMSPLGSGIFVKAKVGDTKQLVMNVGAKVAVVKSTEEAKKLVMENALIYANKLQEDITKE